LVPVDVALCALPDLSSQVETVFPIVGAVPPAFTSEASSHKTAPLFTPAGPVCADKKMLYRQNSKVMPKHLGRNNLIFTFN
jgi:hypothetical protein